MPATIFDPGGCGCPGPSCFISAVLSACVPILFGSPFSIAGITVNVYDSAGGMLLDTGTTNARGFVAFTIGPGTYFVETVGSPEGWLEFAGTITFACAPVTIHRGIRPGWICTNCWPDPLPRTLYITDSNGTWPLVNGGGDAWSGSGTANLSGVALTWHFIPPSPPFSGVCSVPATWGDDSVGYGIILICNEAGGFALITAASAIAIAGAPDPCYPVGDSVVVPPECGLIQTQTGNPVAFDPSTYVWSGSFSSSGCPPDHVSGGYLITG